MPERSTVQPPLRFVPPRFNRLLFRAVSTIYPLYLRFGLNIRRLDVEGIETLVEHYRRFQQKKIRLIVAFRHPHLDDGAIMAWLLSGFVRRSARSDWKRAGRQRLRFPSFAYFIYDRGAPLWAGPFIAWLLPRVGAMSVFRGKLDSHGLDNIRSAVVNGDQPIAIAPEGAVSYNERTAAPLESGVARFAFWCVGDLLDANRDEEVIIVPVTPSYRHGRDASRRLRQVASYLERECGLPQADDRMSPARLRAVASRLFRTAELFYRRFYAESAASIELPETEVSASGQYGANGFRAPEQGRIEAIVQAALLSAEHRLGLPSTGTPIRRVRRIEQASWDRIYREDIGDIASLCPLDRALADRIALETSLTMRHLQLADIMVYLSELAIPDGASIDEMAEAAANLAGVVARLEGGDISATPRLGSRSITYRIGEPISVSSRWEAYRENRQQAVDELMHSLRGEFQRLSSPGKTATEGRSL